MIDICLSLIIGTILASIFLIPDHLRFILLDAELLNSYWAVVYFGNVFTLSLISWLAVDLGLFAKNGKTVGKTFFEIYVLYQESDEPDFLKSVQRSLLKLFTLLSGLWFLQACLKKTFLHSKLSQADVFTEVVYIAEKED